MVRKVVVTRRLRAVTMREGGGGVLVVEDRRVKRAGARGRVGRVRVRRARGVRERRGRKLIMRGLVRGVLRCIGECVGVQLAGEGVGEGSEVGGFWVFFSASPDVAEDPWQNKI